MTPKQRYRLEQAKDKTPSTNWFIWAMLIFLAAAWITRNTDAGQQLSEAASHVHIDLPETQFVKQQFKTQDINSQFSKYPNGDPVCGGDTWCFLGWRL